MTERVALHLSDEDGERWDRIMAVVRADAVAPNSGDHVDAIQAMREMSVDSLTLLRDACAITGHLVSIEAARRLNAGERY